MLSQWEEAMEPDIITLDEDDNVRNYRARDVIAINWKPAKL